MLSAMLLPRMRLLSPQRLMARRRYANRANGQDVFVGLKISQDRLMNDIHGTCQWGRGPRWGK